MNVNKNGERPQLTRWSPPFWSVDQQTPVTSGLGTMVDVWIMSDAPLSLAKSAALTLLLSEQELKRRERFATERLREQYLIARAFVRSVLALYADVQAEQWRFITNAWGRPQISPEQMPASGLHFSLSHTDGCMLLAVSCFRQVGVDVENISRAVNAKGIAAKFFSAIEAEQVTVGDEDQARDIFWLLWVLKEAYVKAMGMGLAIPFDSFGFSLASYPPTKITFNPEENCNSSGWRFNVFAPSLMHAAALAVGPEAPELIELRGFRIENLMSMEFCEEALFCGHPASSRVQAG